MAEKQYGMLVRTERCVGCQTCVVGCHLLHECPTDVYRLRNLREVVPL